MELSRYVFTIPYEDSRQLIFSSLTGCLITLDAACFRNGKLLESQLTPADMEILREGAYLADDSKIISQLDSMYRSPPDTLMLNIEVAGHCNLSCSYCYQHGWPPRGTIQNDTIEKILTYIKKCSERLDYKTVKIDFIGGEPFLAADQMARIFNEVKSFCLGKNLSLEAQAESNGTLLKPQILKLFDHLDLSVTLSAQEDHDKYRAYKNGRGSYEQIVTNLMNCQNLLANHSIKLSLRYNVHAGNCRQFSAFLAEIKRLGLRIETVKTAWAAEYEFNDFRNGLTMEEFLAWNSTEAIDALLEYDYPVSFYPHAVSKRCGAYQPFNCKVFYDGSIGLCNASAYGSSNLSIEELAQNPEALNEHYAEVKNWTPLQDAECAGCRKLLLCGGKTFCRINPCDYSPYDLEIFLKKYVQFV